MPYVGNPLATAFASREKQDLTGQSGTSFTLTHAVSSPNDLSVYINHVRQEPTTAYTVNGTSLTTTGSVASTDDFYIIYDELAVQSISHPTNQALTATAGTFTSGLVGTTATFSGAVSGTTGTFSGDLIVDTSTLKVDAANNRVGINTASPAFNTEISNASTSTTLTGLTDAQLVLVNTGTATANQFTKLGFRFADGSYNGQAMICGVRESATSRATALTFSSAPSSDGDPDEVMRISSTAKVGIGTTNPQDNLHVKLSSGQRVARFESNDNTSAHITFKAPNTSYMPAVGVKDEDFYISTGDAVERLRLKASNGDLVSSQRFLITNEVNSSYTPNATGFGWQNPRDVDSFADITNMGAGLNYAYDSNRFPGWGHTDNVAKTHWGAIVLVGYSGAGQGYYLIAYGYGTSPTILYSANWTGSAIGSASVSQYYLRLTKSTTGSHNVWAMNIGV